MKILMSFVLVGLFLTSCSSKPEDACNCIKESANKYVQEGVEIESIDDIRIPCKELIDKFQEDPNARALIISTGTQVFANLENKQFTEIDGEEPLRGTIMESTGQLVEGWLGDQSRLPKCKVSETVSSKAVFGIYFGKNYAEDNTPNGHLVAAIGAAWVRMSPDYDVQVGDLIESNGDGCAKPQIDDVIRSSTIGKISSTTPAEVYEDNSYLLACVLYCG